MNATQIKDELSKLSIQEDAIVKRYYALLTERNSKQRNAELRHIENQLRGVRARIAKLEAKQKGEK